MMNSKMTQLLQHLQAGNPVTTAQARHLFGIEHLGTYIWRLKRKGYDILVSAGDRDKRRKTYRLNG